MDCILIINTSLYCDKYLEIKCVRAGCLIRCPFECRVKIFKGRIQFTTLSSISDAKIFKYFGWKHCIFSSLFSLGGCYVQTSLFASLIYLGWKELQKIVLDMVTQGIVELVGSDTTAECPSTFPQYRISPLISFLLGSCSMPWALPVAEIWGGKQSHAWNFFNHIPVMIDFCRFSCSCFSPLKGILSKISMSDHSVAQNGRGALKVLWGPELGSSLGRTKVVFSLICLCWMSKVVLPYSGKMAYI